MDRLASAKQAFPFDHRFRLGLAEFYSRVRWKGSRPMAIAAIEDGLRTDPYAMDLHRNLAGLLYEAGDGGGVAREVAILKRFMPHRNVAIIANANPATN